MISKETEELLYKAIKIYDKRVGQDFLIAYSSSKKNPTEYVSIRISEENFWHLLGCKNADDCEVSDKKTLYKNCLLKNSIKEFLVYSSGSSAQSALVKYNVFSKIFDFVENAKILRLCEPTQGIPESYHFELASGSNIGIVGYGKDYHKRFFFPKTTREKGISEINKVSNKILFILCKPIDQSSYESIVYEIKEGIAYDKKDTIPSEYYVSF